MSGHIFVKFTSQCRTYALYLQTCFSIEPVGQVVLSREVGRVTPAGIPLCRFLAARQLFVVLQVRAIQFSLVLALPNVGFVVGAVFYARIRLIDGVEVSVILERKKNLPAEIHQHLAQRGPSEEWRCEHHVLQDRRDKDKPSPIAYGLDFWRTQNAHREFYSLGSQQFRFSLKWWNCVSFRDYRPVYI